MVTATLEKPQNLTYPQWKNATWSEYLAIVENPNLEDVRVFYNEGELWIDMGYEGPLHAIYNDLFTMIFLLWFARHPEQSFDSESMSGCVIAKPNQKGVSPDKILYVGGNTPKLKPGEPRRIDLDKWRVPDLVAEISDTTLAIDLDEKKQIYADLGIREYWVIDIKGNQVIAFILQENGNYQQCEQSTVLSGLPIDLLEQTLTQLEQTNNFRAALWLAEKIAQLDL